MDKKVIGIIIVLVAIASFLGGATFTQYQQKVAGSKVGPTPSPTTKPATKLTLEMVKDVFNKSLIKFGNADSPLIILEISDPSCPFCQVAAGHNGELNKQVDKSRGTTTFTLVADGGTYIAPVLEIEKLVKENKASFAYIYFPGHGNGEMGTKALYCAFEQGKYWEVHNKIMTNEGYNLLNNTVQNDKAKSGELANFLKSAIDLTTMKDCLESGKDDDQLQTEENLGKDLMTSAGGGTGTPGFFINTTFFGGAYNYKDMEPAVQAALK